MDRCICYYDALGTVDTKSAIRKLKRKHTVLADVSRILSPIKFEWDAESSSSSFNAYILKSSLSSLRSFEIGD